MGGRIPTGRLTRTGTPHDLALCYKVADGLILPADGFILWEFNQMFVTELGRDQGKEQLAIVIKNAKGKTLRGLTIRFSKYEAFENFKREVSYCLLPGRWSKKTNVGKKV